MAYDGNSFYGDMICDEYDEQNNLMNPPSPAGFLFYHIIGDAFDLMSEMCSQFMNDFSILTANTKGLDKFWGVSYNMPRPKIHHSNWALFEDNGTVSNHNDGYTRVQGGISITRYSDGTLLNAENTTNQLSNLYPRRLQIGGFYSGDFKLNMEYIYELTYSNPNCSFIIRNENDVDVELGLDIVNRNCKVLIKKIGNLISLYANGELVTEKSITGSTFRILFKTSRNGQTGFRNLQIIDLNESNEQLLTDDEYKIYLYLRNCRLMTREDIEINFNKCFALDDHEIYFSEEHYGLHLTDHLNYDSADTISSNLQKNPDDDSSHFVTDFSNDEETMLIPSGLSTTEEKITIINVPANNWDSGFLSFMEQYISIKGNLQIREYNL